MSYANGTTHYNLPQTVGSDKRDWSDTNQAFADLDAAVYEASAGQIGDAEKIAELQSATNTNTTAIAMNEDNISTNAANILTNKQDIASLKTTVDANFSSVTSELGDVRQDTEDMITSNREASATSTHEYAVGDYFIYNDVFYKATSAIAVGDTIVPNTNCEATNVGTELQNVEVDVDVTELTERVDTAENNITKLETDLNNTNTNLETSVNNVETMITPYQETGDTASNDYKFDELLIWNGKLYQTSEEISTGTTLVAGENVKEVTIETSKLQFPRFSDMTLLGTGAMPSTITLDSPVNLANYKICYVAITEGAITLSFTHWLEPDKVSYYQWAYGTNVVGISITFNSYSEATSIAVAGTFGSSTISVYVY